MKSPPPPPVDRIERTVNPVALTILLVCLAGALIALWLAPSAIGATLMTWMIVILAVCGAFGLLLFAFGLLQFPTTAARLDTTKAIADSNPDGLLVTDRESRIVYANDAYRALSGAPAANDLRPVERLFSGSPDVSESVYRLSQAAKSGSRASEDLRLSPPPSGEGEVAWYRIRVRPLEGVARDGLMAWTVSDETRDHARHETFFQDLQHAIDYLDHAPAGFFSAEPDGSIAHMNATLAGWLDYDLAQFSAGGLKVDDIVAGDGGAMLAMMSGPPGEVTTQKFDVDLKPRQGRLLPVRILHKVAFSGDGTPGPSRSLVINRAPGEIKGEDLRAAEVRFARIFNSTPVAIAAVDAAGQVLRPNAAFARLAQAARGSEAARGRMSIFDLIAERDHGALNASISAASQGKGEIAPLDVSLEGAGPGRSARLFVSAADPTADEGASATIFALDTTEQRTLQANLAQSQKMQAIGQLAGGIAHDFNNLLTAIIGHSDLLLANHRPTDPSFQDIMQIKQTANRAAGLVRQLLAFSRRQTLRPQTLQLNDVLSELQMLLRRLVGETIQLDLVYGRDLWQVKADLNQFEQVILNLVVNARDAVHDGGRITLRTSNFPTARLSELKEAVDVAPGDYVLVEVEDTGHGIPPEVRAKIFEPFFTTKEVGKGTGLGLSMVYGIIKQTGGYVFCDSEPGKGATFRILLPRRPAGEVDEVDEPVKPEAPKPAADLTGRGAILLVEDEEAVRAFASRALASRGYTVLEAETGVDALRVAEAASEPIDLIVSDVIMPEMDGPTMLTELRKRGLSAKVVFVSGYADDAFARNLPEGQDFVFLAKPFSLKQLIETVKGLMN
ncbi:MAG TPA: ATP-binding protein [Roseiarcus sp.]|nr:ATP-binding protein [Roseiarcus sp.]